MQSHALYSLSIITCVSLIRGMKGSENNSIWAKRFMAAAVVQGGVIVGLTVFLVLGQASVIKPEISRVMAAGGAGTWFTLGYVMYIVLIMGVAVSALFYHYLENVMGRSLRKVAKALSWMHLILMNVGTSVSMGLLMYAGYLGGASMLPESVGGQGFDTGQAHSILAPFVEPISAAILIITVGVMAGGASFLVTYRSASPHQGTKSVDMPNKEVRVH